MISSISILLILMLVMIPKIFCDPIFQQIFLHLYRFPFGISVRSIRVRCCTWCIHFKYVISDVVSKSMIDDMSVFVNLRKSLGIHITKLTRRYYNHLFIFFLLMQDNSAEKLHHEMTVFLLFWPLGYDDNCLKASIARR